MPEFAQNPSTFIKHMTASTVHDASSAHGPAYYFTTSENYQSDFYLVDQYAGNSKFFAVGDEVTVYVVKGKQPQNSVPGGVAETNDRLLDALKADRILRAAGIGSNAAERAVRALIEGGVI